LELKGPGTLLIERLDQTSERYLVGVGTEQLLHGHFYDFGKWGRHLAAGGPPGIDPMRRREFVILLGSAAVTRPLATHAQQQSIPVIGFLGAASAELFVSQLRAFKQGLSETGYVEGRNVTIEYRWAEGRYDRLSELATDLVRRRVTVLVTSGGDPPARAAQAATTTIPIVFVMSADPIQLGLVASLSKPGGNLTGVTSLNVEVAPKRLELLREVIPAATTIALLVHPTNRSTAERTALQAAARALGLQLPILQAGSDNDLDEAFGSLARLSASGLPMPRLPRPR
jgi:putative ABC transport system substrate-binding protein